MMPMVTIILPSYNHGAFLSKRIESIFQQSYTDYELIIIDDCSSDNSDEIIKSYLPHPSTTYIRNEKNTGTPFSSWGKGSDMAQGKYIWICESDDFAEPDFLRYGIEAMERDYNNVLFYSNSYIVNEKNEIVGSTAGYFDEVWKNNRWQKPYVANGVEELREFQQRGQIVPNMSSCLIRTDAFRRAYHSKLLRFKLTGDWLFVGLVLQWGNVVFTPLELSNFRSHDNTARVRVKSNRSQAEFILTKYALHKVVNDPPKKLLDLFNSDAIRFIYEDSSAWDVLRAMSHISLRETLSLAVILSIQLAANPSYLKRFFHRLRQVTQNDK